MSDRIKDARSEWVHSEGSAMKRVRRDEAVNIEADCMLSNNRLLLNIIF